ncbi:MAG: 16S rRNA (adenine(1518)-N(6)/adenine(1519)-N(6))-dimethyltransferase RsmA [Flavobacteriaceae bacterium]|nr:16S rRNA (adenine(1518)-N(6)/adenine(1519)-N(6))-dimethyltransferase RsmA [Flavobacteriaceae bacterium]
MFRFAKKFGQHHLTEITTARRIVKSMPINSCKNVLEVGPGVGALTKHLIKEKINLTVVEIDPKSIELLQINVPSLEINIIVKDFLKLDIEEVFDKQQFSLIGNFPYNISSQILFRLIKYRHLIPNLLGMFQKEVAHRIASTPGSRQYGILSVLIQLFYQVEILFDVPSTQFYPKPKVDSSVIRLTRLIDHEYPCNIDLLFKIVQTSFNQRRKKLRNSLKRFLIPESLFQDELFSKRPEELSSMEFVDITRKLENARLPNK